MAEPSDDGDVIRPPPRRVSPLRTLVRLGQGHLRPSQDAYHFFLSTSWARALGAILVVYLIANVLFALGYFACGGVDGMARGSFWQAFFFSVETLSTIGYGQMAPRSAVAHVLVSIEAVAGMLGVAMLTGLMFAKFARPTARVVFSRVAVISRFEGVACLMFRMANERRNQIVEATLHVTLARDEITREGERFRRVYDLQLSRKSNASFVASWTAVHPIVPGSPFYGTDIATLRKQSASIIVSFMGFDDTFSQTVHARYTYDINEIVHNAKFVDVLRILPDGRRALEFDRLHDYRVASGTAALGGDALGIEPNAPATALATGT